jgi:hypothetical protein
LCRWLIEFFFSIEAKRPGSPADTQDEAVFSHDRWAAFVSLRTLAIAEAALHI